MSTGVRRSDREGNPPVSNIVLGEGEPARSRERRGAENGLASLLLGILVALLALLFTVVNTLMAAHGPQGLHMSASDVTLATVGFVVGILLILSLGLVGLLFGIVGLGAARQQGQSAALPLAGVFVNVVGLFLFLMAGITTVFVLVMFNRVVR